MFNNITRFTLAFGFLLLLPQSSFAQQEEKDEIELERERMEYVDQVLALIKGKEDLPSSEVYQNIELFAQVPAGRLLRIMEMGFSRSLGVSCTHCHNNDDWGSEEKSEKKVAREMMGMVQTINQNLLGNMAFLSGEDASVNCTTCHRGDVKPALNLE